MHGTSMTEFQDLNHPLDGLFSIPNIPAGIGICGILRFSDSHGFKFCNDLP